jgi:hypothetical protein
MPKGSRSIARPKKAPPAPPPVPDGERETIVNIKGSAGYAAWLEGVHRKTHIPKVQIFRLAVADWAQRHDHPAPPEI